MGRLLSIWKVQTPCSTASVLRNAAPVIGMSTGSSSERCTAAVFELVCYSGTFDVDAAYARLQIPDDIKVVIEFAQPWLMASRRQGSREPRGTTR